MDYLFSALGMALYSLSCSIYSTAIEKLVKKYNINTADKNFKGVSNIAKNLKKRKITARKKNSTVIQWEDPVALYYQVPEISPICTPSRNIKRLDNEMFKFLS